MQVASFLMLACLGVAPVARAQTLSGEMNHRPAASQIAEPQATTSIPTPSLRHAGLTLVAASPFTNLQQPRAGEPLVLYFILTNAGQQTFTDARLQVRVQESLILETVVYDATLPTIQPNEQRMIEVEWLPGQAGFVLVCAELFLSEEQSSTIYAQTELAIAWPRGAVVLNEIMLKPSGGEPEWVEVLNTTSAPIPLQRWGLRDAARRTGVVAVSEVAVLPPHGYAILTASSTVAEFFVLPPQTPVLVLAGFPVLNNDAETIALLDFTGAQVDSMAYDRPLLDNGQSLERVRSDRDALDADNWQPSQDVAGATPGRRNSVTPFNLDAAIDSQSLRWQPQAPQRNAPIEITLDIVNAGREPIQVDEVVLRSMDASLPDGGIVATHQQAVWLAPATRHPIALVWQPVQSGALALQTWLRAAGDEQARNDSTRFVLPVGFLAGDLLINEIMAVPLPGEPEWIELFNPGSLPVSLSGWRLADTRSVSAAIVSSQVLEPGEFIILAQDSLNLSDGLRQIVLPRWPALNNDQDEVVLHDLLDHIIDNVSYVWPGTGAAGQSLERISPRLPSQDRANWALHVTAAGSSPGRSNSVFTAFTAAQAALHASPNPFSPDGDGHEDVTVISYELPFPVSQVNLTIYDMRGRVLRRLLNAAPSGAQRQLIWDGRTNDGRQLEPGIYLILLEAIDAGGGRLERLHSTVVLASKFSN